MKFWLIVALLAVASSVAVAATAVAKADLTKNATKVIEAETELPASSTDVTGDDEGLEATESSQTSKIVEEESEPKKVKHEKSEHNKEGEQEEGENEEEEAENEEEENEDSEEGDSDEDSEEEESKGKKKKEASKVESEEEGDNKEDAVKIPTLPDEIPSRSRTIASPVTADTYKSAHVSQPEVRKPQPKWLFDAPIPNSPEVSAKVEKPKSDSPKSSTSAAVQISIPSWPVAKSVETRPTYHPANASPSDTHKPHHPKWFFNTAKEKSSDRSTKIESPKPTAVFEIPTRRVAAAQIPTWPPSITTVKPAVSVASNKPVDFSHSDNRKSNSQWFYSTASKPSDGFAKKESNARSTTIEIPTRNKPAAYKATPPWTQSSRPVAPVYKSVEVSSPSPPRKTYPRWFFNIRD